MERYMLVKELGEGAFGSVRQAINQETGEVVAIKQIKREYDSWDECLSLREVKSLQKLNHPKIVKLKELILRNKLLYFVFEYMEQNLYQVIADRKTLFSEAEVRDLCRQVFQGLAYMQKQGYFHRDLKPENLLVTRGAVKIADFGLAREINSRPPFTQYVSTRWYRAPEVILQSDFYNSKVDMWAMGAIMAELFTLRPLFPGTGEANQMYKICSVLGAPTMDSWADGIHLARTINYQFPEFDGVPLSALIPSASEDAISLISMLCSWNPCNRPTADEALKHPFFRSCFYIPPSLRFRDAASAGTSGESEQECYKRYHGALSNSILNHSFPSPNKLHAYSSTPVHRDLNRANQHVSIPAKQFRFGPQSSNMGGTTARGVSDTADTLPHMTNGSRKQFVVQPRLLPLKAGEQGIAESADMFIRPAQKFHPATIYTGKVAV
jgi:protein kinase